MITRLPAPGDTFSTEAAFFAACHNGVPKELGFSMYKHYDTRTVLASSCSKRVSVGCPFRIRALFAPAGNWIVSAERSCWTHDHTGKGEKEDTLSESGSILSRTQILDLSELTRYLSDEESSPAGDDVVDALAHHAPSQSDLSVSLISAGSKALILELI